MPAEGRRPRGPRYRRGSAGAPTHTFRAQPESGRRRTHHDQGAAVSYDDVKQGARVSVTDALGNTLGVTSLEAGHAPDGQHCAFGFDLVVADGARPYHVAVAGQPAQQFSAAQLRHGVTVSLGG